MYIAHKQRHTAMEIGLYRVERINGRVLYHEVARYDTDNHSWGDRSDGRIVSQVSESPSCQELIYRFEYERSQPAYRVCSPETATEEADEVHQPEPTQTVAEGKATREKIGHPPLTKHEQQWIRNNDLVLYDPDSDREPPDDQDKLLNINNAPFVDFKNLEDEHDIDLTPTHA